MIQFYGYPKCSTCQKAKKDLERRSIRFQEFDITKTPPAKAELQAILAAGKYPLSKLFNTSGELYREMNMKEKLPTMSKAQILELLSRHGKLIKRPVAIEGSKHTVGYDEQIYAQTWK